MRFCGILGKCFSEVTRGLFCDCFVFELLCFMIRWRISCLFLSQSGENPKQITWLAHTRFPAGLSLAARITFKIKLVHLNVSSCHDWSEALLRFCFYDALLKTAIIIDHCIILAGLLAQISQMPIVLIPVHFDRDPIDHIPSCQRSVVIRTFITNDFMTGVPATPGKHIPIEVSGSDIREGSRQPGV